MPSDDAYERIGEMFSPATAAFRSAVTDAVEQVRSHIEAHSPPGDGPGAAPRSGLGVFGAGHIDEDRFAALFGNGDMLDADTLRLLDRALGAMREVSNAAGPGFRVEVGPGGDVAAIAASAFASIGRAFGAARLAELVRTGRVGETGGEDAGAPFAFARWTAAERRIAPPLIIRLAGADLDAAAFAPYLDGNQKIVLLVEEPAPAASLARLITPGTFVMQCTDPADVARLASFDGPGIAAIVPEGCATFVHDPAAQTSARLVVTTRPEGRPRALRRSSVFQQTEALALLDLFERALDTSAAPAANATATQPAAPAATTTTANGTAKKAADPADTLAAWLLAQADLSTTGPATGR